METSIVLRRSHLKTENCCMDTVPQRIHRGTVWIRNVLFSAKAAKVFTFLYLRSLFPKSDEKIPKTNEPKPAWMISLQPHNKQKPFFFFFFQKVKIVWGYFTETTPTTAWFIFLVVRNEIKKKTGFDATGDNPSFYEFIFYIVISLIQSFHKTPVSIKFSVSIKSLVSSIYLSSV